MPVEGAPSRIVYDADEDADELGYRTHRAVRGFGVRITRKGARSFILNYRFRGQERQLTIGAFPTWTTQEARVRAGKLVRQIDEGKTDPLHERKAALDAPTFGAAPDRYFAEGITGAGPPYRANRVLTLAVPKRNVGTTSAANAAIATAPKCRAYGAGTACWCGACKDRAAAKAALQAGSLPHVSEHLCNASGKAIESTRLTQLRK